MWTEITRPQYRRDGLRYASDTTDGEWAVIAALMPPPHKGRGRRRTTPLRGGERHLLHRPERLPVADAAQGFSALYHGAALLLSLARQRPVATDQPCPADAGA